jgi:5-methyltetrahydropteroyltriglutamate--homocysteine methyltransferase
MPWGTGFEKQRRTHFFLYVAHRMNGFGGAWNRPLSTSVTKYPEFMRMKERMRNAQAKVQPGVGVPMAIGPISYAGFDEIKLELSDFARALKLVDAPFVEKFMTAASPGIIATALKNEHYDSLQNYLNALGEAMRHEYEAIANAGFLLQIDSPDLAYERSGLLARSRSPSFWNSQSLSLKPLIWPFAIFPESWFGCMCVGATSRRRMMTMSRSRTFFQSS